MTVLDHDSRGATASLLEHPTSGEISDVTKWATKQLQAEPGYLPLRARLKDVLAQLNPKEITVDRILITVLGDLDGLGVDLSRANAMASIDIRPGLVVGPKLPLFRQWWRWMHTNYFSQSTMKGV